MAMTNLLKKNLLPRMLFSPFSTWGTSKKISVIWNEDEIKLGEEKKVCEVIKTISTGLNAYRANSPKMNIHIYSSRYADIKRKVDKEKLDGELDSVHVNVYQKLTNGKNEIRNAMQQRIVELRKGMEDSGKKEPVLFLMSDPTCHFKGGLHKLNKHTDVFLMLDGKPENKYDIVQHSTHNWCWEYLEKGEGLEGKSSAIRPKPVEPEATIKKAWGKIKA